MQRTASGVCGNRPGDQFIGWAGLALRRCGVVGQSALGEREEAGGWGSGAGLSAQRMDMAVAISRDGVVPFPSKCAQPEGDPGRWVRKHAVATGGEALADAGPWSWSSGKDGSEGWRACA